MTGTAKVSVGNRLFYVHLDSRAVITGGTFYHDPSDYVDSEKYTVTQNDDGTWSVTAR